MSAASAMAAPALLPASYPSAVPQLSTSRDQYPNFRGVDSCSTMAELKQYHSQIIRLGLSDDNDAVGRVLKFCGLHPSGDLGYALCVFEQISNPDPFIYNTLIRAHSQFPSPHHSLLLYSRMLHSSVLPNKFTFPPLLKSICTNLAIGHGRQVHCHVLKLGFHTHDFSQNNLIHMYLNCSRLEDGRRVFDKMCRRDIVSWTTLISGYVQCGRVDDARELFDAMPHRNSVSWNTMITAYVQRDRFVEAFELFVKMGEEGVELDKFLAASLLCACTGLGALEQGQWIHGYIEKSGINMDSKLSTTVIDMYCKCGCMEKAYEVFRALPCKELSSWNCMIGGLAMHGQGEAAIKLFAEMEREMVTPDGITLLNVLSACAHVGLVMEGRYYFDYMINTYGIEPKMEHYGCLVDLLGRAGLIWEANGVIDDMPMEPNASVLGALLGACKIHGELELGEKIGWQVIELEPSNSGRYVLLANLYASVGRWDDVANVRKLMNHRRVNKEPGFSMIEMDGVISQFIAGGRSHPQSEEIYAKVDEILERIRSEGYLPDTSGVLHDIGHEEKENPLYYHSEKLAIAYGLLNTGPGETIRISKNLRVCKDCHEASKLISRAFDRIIIVRDRSRFHHFKDGKCSCKEFW